MANTAAFLVDRVLPDVPLRQYVLTTPYELRKLVAFKADVFALPADTGIFSPAEYRRCAREKDGARRSPGRFWGRIKRYTNVDLLAFDELGYVPCDARAADLLFQIISRRHEKASTVIATNLAFKEWGPMFHGAASLVPLIDRFTQHLVTIDIEGESYRQKEKDKPPTPPRTPSSARGAPTVAVRPSAKARRTA